MIKLNFLPEGSRKAQGGVLDDGIGPLRREVILGAVVAAAALMALVHLALLGLAGVKIAKHTMHQVQWSAMSADKKFLDDIITETRGVQVKMAGLKAVTSGQGLSWGRLLNEISDSVPKGLWVRQLRFEGGTLTIDGSSVSKARNEMIIVNNFVAALKERSALKAGFNGVDVDSIERRENSSVSIADFSLKARRKAP